MDGRQATGPVWSAPEPLADRQAIQLRVHYALPAAASRLTLAVGRCSRTIRTHQTFVNIYERRGADAGDSRSRAPALRVFPGHAAGRLAVIRRFVPAGVHHILIGPDHLLFLVGLLLLGGSLRQLVLVVTAFTVAHSVTLSLAALNIVSPPARLIEPAIALSIVYVGADNLLVRGGRDVRAWIAFAFGFIHGFGFANVLREMELPPRALGWSLLFVQPRRGDRPAAGRGAVASALALMRAQERGGRPPGGGRRVDRRHRRRRILVRSAGVVLSSRARDRL